MNELEQMVYSMPSEKAIQLKDETYEEIVNLCKTNNFILVKHKIGYIEIVDGIKMFHQLGSQWWLMTKQYEQHVQLCQRCLND